jgi:hypothetical protein
VDVGNISKSAGIVRVRLGAAVSADDEGSAVRPQPTTETTSTSIQIRESFFINDTPYHFFNAFIKVGAGVVVEVDLARVSVEK